MSGLEVDWFGVGCPTAVGSLVAAILGTYDAGGSTWLFQNDHSKGRCEMLDLTDVDAVRAFVDDVIFWGSGDPERAHSEEDELLRLVANTYAPAQIQSELARLAAADFPRWCA